MNQPPIKGIAARIGRWSAQHRKKAILGWLGFVLAALVFGMNLIPPKLIDRAARAPARPDGRQGDGRAFPKKSSEQVLIQSGT